MLIWSQARNWEFVAEIKISNKDTNGLKSKNQSSMNSGSMAVNKSGDNKQKIYPQLD
jgi:hypothetical protein